jgi:hypothetical protein
MSIHHRSPIVIAWVFVLVSLLVLAAGPAAPVGEAAKDASITITADKQHVNPGDNDTLHIKLQNVKNATLDGQALKGNKIDRKVLVCETTTYTVDGTDPGGKKVSQSLTVYANGFSSIQACLPDLAVSGLKVISQTSTGSGPDDSVRVCVDFTIVNRGKTSAPASSVLLTASGDYSPSFYVGDIIPLSPGQGSSVSPAMCTLRPHGEALFLTLVSDPKNQMIDPDRLNNTQVITVTVASSNLTPKNAPLGPGLTLPGLTQP